MALARTFLGLNAGFSTLSGLTLLVTGTAVANLMFAEPSGWEHLVLLALGIGLLVFAADLVLLASDRFVTAGQVRLIVAADLVWIVASLALLSFLGSLFTTVGAMLISAVAVAVAFFAVGQWVGSHALEEPKSKAEVALSQGVLEATVERNVDAPADVVWRVMTDHPAYADVASNIARVEVLDGDGLGMQRRCYDPKGQSWSETCDLYQEGSVYGFTIHTDAPDYPYPLSHLKGRWSVTPLGQGAHFRISIHAIPKGGFLARMLFVAVAKRQFKAVLVDLADAWANRMEQEARD